MGFSLYQSAADFRAACDRVRGAGGTLALVPTMGALHEGHLALIDEGAKRCDRVAVTIFVNPTQFGPGEDFAAYPRQLDRDLNLCRNRGAAFVFAPNPIEMYQAGEQTRVRVGSLAETLCGARRPGHFEGVTTVVSKLFALAAPCVAIFGRKDYQQLKIIERMVRDLFFSVQVVGHAIVREKSGLALSSRNSYLSSVEKDRSLSIARGLSFAIRAFADGERRAARLRGIVEKELKAAELVIDYVSVADPEELTSFDGVVPDTGALLAVAAFVGRTRLIDNCILGMDSAPAAG
jgi:pantoate--beta-alanine ligase